MRKSYPTNADQAIGAPIATPDRADHLQEEKTVDEYAETLATPKENSSTDSSTIPQHVDESNERMPITAPDRDRSDHDHDRSDHDQSVISAIGATPQLIAPVWTAPLRPQEPEEWVTICNKKSKYDGRAAKVTSRHAGGLRVTLAGVGPIDLKAGQWSAIAATVST